MKLLIALLLLTSCSPVNETEEVKQIRNIYKVVCVDVGDIVRCENIEVKCYIVGGNSNIQCQFKGDK